MENVVVVSVNDEFTIVVTEDVVSVVIAEVLVDPIVSALVVRVDLLEERLAALEP